MTQNTAWMSPQKQPSLALWRPSVAASLAYVALFTLLVLWMMATLDERSFSGFVLRERIFGLTLFHLLSLANGVGLTVLILDVGAARRSSAANHRAQFWGLLLAIVMMIGVQVATFSMLNAAETLAGP